MSIVIQNASLSDINGIENGIKRHAQYELCKFAIYKTWHSINHNFMTIVNMNYECNANSLYMSIAIQNANLSDINDIVLSKTQFYEDCD